VFDCDRLCSIGCSWSNDGGTRSHKSILSTLFKEMSDIIAVTAASGQLGRLVIASLLEKGVEPATIVAVVRKIESVADLAEIGISVRQGDYSDSLSLEKALTGVSTVLIISGTDFGQRVAQHAAIVDAAKKGGAKHIVYTSVIHADNLFIQLAAEQQGSEKVVQESGLAYTILRNGWYLENFTDRIKSAVATGALVGSAKDGKVSGAARSDYAEAAAIVLANPSGHKGKVYELAGDTGVTMDDLASMISKVANKEIVYSDMPMEAFSSVLTEYAGMPGQFASMIAEADTALAAGLLEDNGKVLSTLIGHATTTFETLVKETVSTTDN
jgi:NAD(P)H dehydrogenase (quinone)